MSKNFFEIYQIKDDYLYTVKNYWDRVYKNKTRIDKETGAPVSRPYFGPIFHDNLEIYIPLSSKSSINKNGVKKLKTLNHDYEMFTYNKNAEPRGYINFTRIVICPKNNNFVEKRSVEISKADLIFINEPENANEIILKTKNVYDMLLIKSKKFYKLAMWCKHPETHFPPKSNNVLHVCVGVFFIVMFVFIIVLVVTLSSY